MKKLGIVCPCFNEADYIRKFVDDIESQTVIGLDSYEVTICFVDGMSNDGTYEILEEITESKDYINVLKNQNRYVSEGLNLSIAFFRKNPPDFLIRMDLHSEYPANYVELLVNNFEKISKSDKNVANVGVALKTLPSDNQITSQLIAKAISSKFGVGSSDFRVIKDNEAPKLVDTVPFGCFKFSIFDEVGLFDTNFIRNQDDEFNLRLTKYGYNIYLVPNVSVSYYARSDLMKLSKMFYQYGFYKPLVNYKLKRFASYRQFAPLGLVLALIFSLIIAALNSVIPIVFLLTTYIGVVLYFFCEQKLHLKSRKLLHLYESIRVLSTIHFSYGYGYGVGVINILLNKKVDNVPTSR